MAERERARWLAEIEAGLLAWREAHPRATLAEIEAALDAQLDPFRARVLTAAAERSPLADLSALPGDRPQGPDCGVAYQATGQEARTVRTRGNQPIRSRRSAARCPACERRVFPPR